jgi:hypothetical protein
MPVSSMDVLNEAIREANEDQKILQRCFASREALMDKLKCGQVEAYGIALGERLHGPIPKLGWETITTLFEYDDRIGSLDVGYDGVTLYRNALVDAAAIQNFWPSIPKPVSIQELPSDDDVREVIRRMIRDHCGFIGQEKGANIVRKQFPGFPKKKAMQLVKELTGNEKPGPRGPRKNRV